MEDMIEQARERIIDYANNDTEYGWLTVHHKGRNYKFPKRAMLYYVFERSIAMKKLLPEYKAFSGFGWKTTNDNRYHTDVLLGGGVDLIHYSNQPFDRNVIDDVLFQASIMIEKEFKDLYVCDFVILANGRKETYLNYCMVYQYDPPLKESMWSSNHIDSVKPDRHQYTHTAIVIPHAGVEFAHAAKNADVIISERGGRMCHLAIVSAEQGKILIRMDNAVERFKPFTRFDLDLNQLTFRINYVW